MSFALEVDSLVKSYGPIRAVDSVCFAVEPGQVVALLGPNGSGKTTTIRCAAGLLRPDSGSIRVAGFDLYRDYREARRRFTYLPQQAHFPAALSVREALEFHARLRGNSEADCDLALELVGLPRSVQDRLTGQLSGGMRQRLSLAVASLSNTPLVLLDEPTANLDPEAALKFRQVAKQWRAAGRALVLSTHVLTDVEELADEVIVLVAGKPVAREAITKLRARLMKFARLRVLPDSAPEPLRAVALAQGAVAAEVDGGALVVTAPEDNRMRILGALAGTSGVRQFETEKPSLEDLYMEYVHTFTQAGGEVDASA